MFGLNKKIDKSQDDSAQQEVPPESKPSLLSRLKKNLSQEETPSSPKSSTKEWFARLKQGLNRTRENLAKGLEHLFHGKKTLDDELLEEVETLLLTSDVGVTATQALMAHLNAQIECKTIVDPQGLFDALRAELLTILQVVEQPLRLPEEGDNPFVILVIGVNGTGKTTTIGKLAQHFRAEGHSVMLAAGDTFRAAAVEQLKIWGERNEIPVIAQMGRADSASVVFDALQAATARKVKILIADTAGRLHTQDNLMEELKKVKRVIGKLDPTAPHETMLVVDAGTGQNALSQAKQFHQAIGLTGITLTKLDGTAKGGIIFAIAKEMGLPIRFIGVGEQLEDLRVFTATQFVEALLSRDEDKPY